VVLEPGDDPDDKGDIPMFNRVQKTLMAVAAFAALALGGSALAGAASSQSTTTTTTTTQSGSITQSQPAMPAHGGATHENAEKAVTGDAATKAKDAAVKSVGSGTAGDVTTDFTGDGYEVTVTKSDGSTVEVHLDNSFNVMQGHGGPGDGNGPPGG
jgi:hypothetical protein